MMNQNNIQDIPLDDPRIYAIAISNLIFSRIEHLQLLNTKLKKNIIKLYKLSDTDDKNKICDEIHIILSQIEHIIIKNIEDTQILEYAIVENTKPSTLSIETLINQPDSHTHNHMYN